MAEIENHNLALLQDIRKDIAVLRDDMSGRFARMENHFAVIELHQEEQGKKIDKLGVDIYGIRGRMKNMEDAVETIARIVSEGTRI